jgi:hypothetical protein
MDQETFGARFQAQRASKPTPQSVRLKSKTNSLIRAVRLPVIQMGANPGNPLNYRQIVSLEDNETRVESVLTLFFSLLAGSGAPGDRFAGTASATKFTVKNNRLEIVDLGFGLTPIAGQAPGKHRNL